ncbi:MAG: hypothetical protein KatS3mg079_654 [Caloramator sp.]|nr:MAG: hypothetical protein KatS3mg079_654 [Caloramator sp.]
MRFEMEITKDCVIRRFIDGDLILEERWIKKGEGRYGTTGIAIEDKLQDCGYDEELIEAIEDGDFIDIFKKIR